MFVGRRLRYQHVSRFILDKVMRANVGHDLCAGEDLGMELLLDLVPLLYVLLVG